MKRLISSLLALALITSLTMAAEEGKSPEKPATKKQTHCPVMQRYEIDGTMWVDVKGLRIYTCCKGCQHQIKVNPDKYIKRLTDKGVKIEKAPKAEKKPGNEDK